MPIEATLDAAIRASIKLLKYKLIPGGSTSDYRFKLAISSGNLYRAQIVVYEPKVAALWVFLTDNLYHVSKKKGIYELASRLDELLPLGNVFIQAGSGAVIFKSGFDAEAITPSPSSITRWLNQAAYPISLFESAYAKLSVNWTQTALKLVRDDIHPAVSTLANNEKVERSIEVLLRELKTL